MNFPICFVRILRLCVNFPKKSGASGMDTPDFHE